MSQTKAVTSVGIMILYKQGKFLLDEPISDFIPEFKNTVVLDKFNDADTSYTTVPAKREISFRDLLTHTSGLDYTDIGSSKMGRLLWHYLLGRSQSAPCMSFHDTAKSQ